MQYLKSVQSVMLSVLLAGAVTVTGALPAMASSGDEVQSGDSYLGIGPRDISPARVQALKLKDDSGVEVTELDNDAPAAKAGMKLGDVILNYNGQKVESAEQLRRLIHETPVGRSVQIVISRNGQQQTLSVTPGSKRQMNAAIPKSPRSRSGNGFFDNPPDMSMNLLQAASKGGLLVENITPQLGEFLGVKNGNGVMVRSVEKGSPAEFAGLRAGDVIVRIEKDSIADMSDWHRLTHKRSGKTMLGVVRDKHEQNFFMEFPSKRDSSWMMDLPDINPDEIKFEVSELRPEMLKAFADAQGAFDSEGGHWQLDQDEIQKAIQNGQQSMDKAMKQFQDLHKQWNCTEDSKE
ncbi:Pdz/Dhr/GlgF [Candidatus Koribacter versatilis Ellin345]|uniref:Pdz/Dhr/GlgF n=1 Tax=Koribacter versatilis (strain Ellin345) TaxID=204669 RepID=Q1IHX6_KORVE|nr:PDZ domain-containing protein [Candidatus Koribacter versatilis]ABF43524.1 Pdz/Dhr/GlgF [Candidatus Koribacter versatilis Ellin345]